MLDHEVGLEEDGALVAAAGLGETQEHAGANFGGRLTQADACQLPEADKKRINCGFEQIQ